ncbi:MAG: carboxypeptidase regulatory-like domain-containing protein [Bryobacteraceae bacterium]
MPKPLCLLMLLARVPFGPASAQTVEGNVIDSLTGNGIPAMRVEIRPASGETSYFTMTDVEGHFVVEGVRPGTYAAGAKSPGYSLSGFPSVFRVTAGGNPVKVQVRMIPLPRISGRVVDGRGEGVAHAQLELLGAGRLLEESTDATGKFELRPLPGGYILSVVPPPGLKPPNPDPEPDPEPHSARVLVWARTFYPGVALPEAASKIVAQPGGEVSNIDLKLVAVPVHAVRGVLLNPDGSPAPKVAITLTEEAGQAHRAESHSDGAFEFPAVVDGEWPLSAEVENGGVKLRVVEWIEMAGHELEGVSLRLTPPFTVRGKLVMETPPGEPAANLPLVSLVPHAGRTGREAWMANWMLRPEMHFVEPIPANAPGGAAVDQMRAEISDSFAFAGAISARPDADGNFTLQNVYPGRYRIVPMPPSSPPYYLDAVRAGGTDVAPAEVEISSGAVPIAVVYRTNGGVVRGTVEKCASGPVLLVSQETVRRWLGFLRAAQCDSNDRYEITAVRPGEYYALALAGSGPLPELNEGLLSQAGKVTVRAGEASSADLRAIPRPAY